MPNTFYFTCPTDTIALFSTVMEQKNILRKLRLHYEYKQSYLAYELGNLSQSAYSKMEKRNVEEISHKHLRKLAEVYNTTEDKIREGHFNAIILGDIGTVNGPVVNGGEVNYNQEVKYLQPDVEARVANLEAQIQALLQRLVVWFVAY